MLPETTNTSEMRKQASERRGKKAESECLVRETERGASRSDSRYSLSLSRPCSTSSSLPFLFLTSTSRNYILFRSLFSLSLSSAKDPRHAVDDRGPLSVKPPPTLLPVPFFLLSFLAAAVAVAAIVWDPHEQRPLAHRPDGVAAVLPRALLARDLEPGREGDEALVVVPLKGEGFFFCVFRFFVFL